MDNYFDSAWYSSQPVGIALDSSGYLYVADQVNHLVNKYTGSGGFVRSWSYGTPGVGYSDIPKGIAVSSSGYVYVADDNNTHVKKFDTNGNSASCGGTLCSATFNNIGAIAVDSSGNVYVGDSASTNIGRIQKFSSSGSLLTSWNGNSSGLGPPTGIAVDASGYVYVLDAYKVWKYNSTGSSQMTAWDATGGDEFAYLYGIAVDSNGDIYVVNTMGGQVNKFMYNGTSYVLDVQWGSMGAGSGQFNYPLGGIVADSSGHVWVGDTYNSGIQKFSPLPDGPSNLSATASSSGHMDLSWQDNSENETGFYIKRKQGVRGSYSTLTPSAGAGQTTYDDSNVPSGYTYYYTVWAKNSYGDSAYSNEVSVAPYTLTVSKSGAGVGTVTSSPSGINCGAVCVGDFYGGASVTLTATPDSRSRFSSWLGCGSSSTCTITMTGDTTQKGGEKV